MGFDEGRMVLDSINGTYYSGQIVHGKLIFEQKKVKNFRGIYVAFKGFCHVHWTTRHTRQRHGRRESYTVNHDAHEEYVNAKVYLVGGESGDHSIQPGNYEYPFQFRLPVNCPSSFEGQYGHIRYEIKAVVDKAFAFDQEKKIAVRVMAPLDLNLDPYCREPIEMELEESYCCCCVRSGSCEVRVKLPVAGYCLGQTIPVELTCSNKGGVGIDNIILSITTRVTFIATSNPGRKNTNDTVAELKKGPIPANTNRNWMVDMDIPAMDLYNLSGCQYINLEYLFKVVISPDGCHSDSESFRTIVLGTVPLVGYQDSVPNPLQDQLPQQIHNTQQPVSSYPPTLNAYPQANSPQSFGNPPYPVSEPYPGNSPCPAQNPYLNDNTKSNPPYPAPNSPYPPSISPYPPSNSPYPSANPPYPVSGSPYPTASSPYSAANPPYPKEASYPDNPPPYPGNLTNPPYPDTNSPYPPQNVPYETKPNFMPSPGGLRTGNLGFMVRGGTGMNVPPGTPNAGPQNTSSSTPFAAASAPAPDTPDALPDKKD